jgi:N-acyl homoserine lactone hydrolase
MADLKIHPLHVGTLRRDLSTFTYMRNVGKIVDFPVIMWYIEGADARILVDTAAPPPAECPPTARPYEQPADQHVRNTLDRLGLKPEEIEIVILTHLHWDHCLNTHLFPKARFIVQRAELRYAAAPLPVHYGPYGGSLPGTRALLPADTRLEIIEGDKPITRGVSVALLPGHTPGIQGVTVDTDSGTYLIASDNVPFYLNWEGEPPHLPHIPSNLHVNLEDYFQSFAKMERIADHVLPSHDFRVLENSTYPG